LFVHYNAARFFRSAVQRIRPAEAVCPDLLIGFKSMAYVMRYSDFPIEVLSADDLGRRRDWSDEEKVRIVEESLQGFRQGSVTARRYGLSRSLLTRWRREYRSGLLSGSASTGFVPLTISPSAASCELASPPRSEDDKTIEIGLPNVLVRMPNMPVSRLPELLPWNWTAAGSVRQMARATHVSRE
jgi:transposase